MIFAGMRKAQERWSLNLVESNFERTENQLPNRWKWVHIF
jgi:hypothetical protein